MARPTRVMAKQVTATSAISGPIAATSARGSADAVVVIARAFWAFTAGAANWAFTDLRRRIERNSREQSQSFDGNARLPSGSDFPDRETIRVALNWGGRAGGYAHTGGEVLAGGGDRAGGAGRRGRMGSDGQRNAGLDRTRTAQCPVFRRRSKRIADRDGWKRAQRGTQPANGAYRSREP